MGGSYEADSGRVASACLFLLFEPGRRPDGDAVAQALASSQSGFVSHDPRGGQSQDDAPEAWLELLVDGLTFDMLGLAPLAPLQWPKPRHYFGIAPEAIGGCEAVVIAPGPHLGASVNAMPVIRSMMGLTAAMLAQLDGAVGVIWQASGSVIGQDLFVQMIGSWLQGGVFPALGLTSVYVAENGCLTSDGLAFFTGQEIEIAADLSQDRPQATRLALRLIDTMVGAEKLDCATEILGPDNRPLRLTPMADGRRLRVSSG